MLSPCAQEHPDLGPCTAHSGMLSSAAAVWEDLQRHGILKTLLHPSDDSHDSSDNGSHHRGHSGGDPLGGGGGPPAGGGGHGDRFHSGDHTGSSNSSAGDEASNGSGSGSGGKGASGAVAGTKAASALNGEAQGAAGNRGRDADTAEAEAKAQGPESGSKDYVKCARCAAPVLPLCHIRGEAVELSPL